VKVRASIGDWKMVLIAAFHKDRVLAWQFLPRNEMVNSVKYLEFLENRLHLEIRRAQIHRPLIFHHNAFPHKQSAIKDFFNRHRWRVLRHPPYSPDLSPPDIDGFTKIKQHHKGVRYQNEAELIRAFEGTINEINTKNSFKGIRSLPCRWEAVIQDGGEYIK